jgi:hypothetical protein
MVFFDDQRGNIETVKALGVTAIITPEGVYNEHLADALQTYAQKGKR